MTDERQPDPRRALDGVDPPEQWADIVARSAGADVVDLVDRPARAGSSRWVAGAAAAVLLLVVGAVAVLAFRGGDGDGGGIAADGPAGFWGSRWSWTSSERDGQEVGADDLGIGTDRVPVLDLTVEGTVAFRGCNSGGGPARIDGDRLVTEGGFAMTEMACADPDGAALMDLDAEIGALLAANPTVAVDGDRLVLTGPDGAATFERADRDLLDGMFHRRWSATTVDVDGVAQDLHGVGGLVLVPGEASDEVQLLGMCAPPIGIAVVEGFPKPQFRRSAETSCEPDPGDQRLAWVIAVLGPTDPGSAHRPPLDISMTDEQMTLSNESATITFEASDDPAGLVGTTWTVDRALDGDVERTLVPDEGIDDVHFGISTETSDGETLTYAWFDGGCNGVGGNGGLTFDGDRLVPGAVGSREMACAGGDGEARMEQDAWFADVVRAEPLVLFQGDRLVLWTNDARIELSREPDPDGTVSSPPDTSSSGTSGSAGSSAASEPAQIEAEPLFVPGGPWPGSIPVVATWACGPADGRVLLVVLGEEWEEANVDSLRITVRKGPTYVASRVIATSSAWPHTIQFEEPGLSSAEVTSVAVADEDSGELLGAVVAGGEAPICG
ncbi:MAG: META domain-containing protein [Actinobacteria bacterium]|nr:META domain-containing protein [Actinomycetota bacterium]